MKSVMLSIKPKPKVGLNWRVSEIFAKMSILKLK